MGEGEAPGTEVMVVELISLFAVAEVMRAEKATGVEALEVVEEETREEEMTPEEQKDQAESICVV